MIGYAPVLIPTLNRYQHIKNCIESLAKNPLAKETELYISVDYPPAEKYEQGYQLVTDYLDSGISGFKAVHIYKQEKNLGVFKNADFLRSKAFEKCEGYIVTEDDNIFSEDFLDYINYYLNKYEKDDSVFAVCGYSYPIDWKMDSNAVFFCKMFSAWGYGCWKSKFLKYGDFQKEDIRKYLCSFSRGVELYKKNRFIFSEAVFIACDKHYFPMYDADGKFYFMDLLLCIRNYMTDEKVIMPVLSKARNEGHDGSGINCNDELHMIFEKQIIDENDRYIPAGEPILSARDHDRILNDYFPVKLKTVLKALVLWAGILCKS